MANNAIAPAQAAAIKADHTKAMKAITSDPKFKARMVEQLKDAAPTFLASVLDLYVSDSNLIQCDPNAVMQEALKAALLHLPVVKSLGFAYVVPYKGKPTFVLGYKGLVQLAMRTGHYRTINAGEVYEGETVKQDRITGEMSIEGTQTSENAIGYFAHFSLINGFTKTIYWTREQVVKHAKAKSRSFSSDTSPWHTDFDAMAEKTLLRRLLTKYGELSVDMTQVIAEDDQPEAAPPVELPPIMMDAAPVPLETVPDAESPAPAASAPAPEDDGCPF
jgi:recombination protein RecT